MTTFLLVVSVSLGIVFLWGLLAPRSQWRALVSWTYRDPYANEPSGSAYLLYRVIAALGLATMVVSGVLTYHAQLEHDLDPPPLPTAGERMWGNPTPVVVNRVITSLGKAPTGLVDQPILGYQAVTGQTRQPPYLFRLGTFDFADATTENGFIGADPSPGLTALDTAGLVIQVAGDPQCFPHSAIVRETGSTVSIALYYGRADPKDGSNDEFVAECTTLASGANVSTLIPIHLAVPLGERTVQTLAGDPIRNVPYTR